MYLWTKFVVFFQPCFEVAVGVTPGRGSWIPGKNRSLWSVLLIICPTCQHCILGRRWMDLVLVPKGYLVNGHKSHSQLISAWSTEILPWVGFCHIFSIHWW